MCVKVFQCHEGGVSMGGRVSSPMLKRPLPRSPDLACCLLASRTSQIVVFLSANSLPFTNTICLTLGFNSRDFKDNFYYILL